MVDAKGEMATTSNTSFSWLETFTKRTLKHHIMDHVPVNSSDWGGCQSGE